MAFWKKWFGKKEEEIPLDPFTDLVLEKLNPGYLLDYDTRTWEVTAHHYHDMGDGYRREEWELRCEEELYYLNREEDDGIFWSWTRNVPMESIGTRLRGYIQQNGDPPEFIDHGGIRFRMQSYGGAKFYRNCQPPPQPFLYWDYADENGERLLTIEQWGDIEFEAYIGLHVEEYQFTNILPRELPR